MAIKAGKGEVTASDAALALGVAYGKVLRWIQTGKVRGTKRGGHWYAKVDRLGFVVYRAAGWSRAR